MLARELSVELLKLWLTRYKFKDWTKTESHGTRVTKKMKEDRASEIARELSDHTRWLKHGRGIDMETLRDDLRARIEDLGKNPELKKAVWDYYWLLRDHMNNNGTGSFVHTLSYF